MNRILYFIAIVIYSIFLGSQITEGYLLVPFWKTLSTTEFYAYYAENGPIIAKFYSVLTVLASMIPLSISLYCLYIKSKAIKYALASTVFALLVIAIFYGYFKDVNEEFYSSTFSANELINVLKTWSHWHFARVIFIMISLFMLVLSLHKLMTEQKSNPSEIYNY